MHRLIFLDVDDTLLSPPYTAVARVARLLGKTLPPEEDFLNRDAIQFYDAFPHIFKNARQMWLYGLMALPFGYFRSQRPLQYDIAGVGAVLADHRVYLVSKNPPVFTRWRLRRLKEIFGVQVGSRYIACGPIVAKGPSKLEIMRAVAAERGADLADCLVIDDSVETIFAAAAAGLRTALVDSAWNKPEQAQCPSNCHIVATAELPALMRDHLDGSLQPDKTSAYVVPPLSLTVVARLVLHFVKQRLIFGAPLPAPRQVVPLGRHPLTSKLFVDPHAQTHRHFERLVEPRPDPSSLRVVFLKERTRQVRLPFAAVGAIESAEPATRVMVLRDLCKEAMRRGGAEVQPGSVLHFRAVSRARQIERLIRSPRVAEAVTAHVAKHQVPVTEARKLAHAYAHEIAGGRSYLGCLWGWQVLDIIFARVFARIQVTMHPAIATLERDHFLIYTSIHRSYLDSGILYTVVAKHTNSFPFIVAADKMRKNWLGRMGAQAGSFFVRRKFVDDIYAAVMAEHVDTLHAGGNAMEVFLEGQRSRSGLTLPPKKGIASIVHNGMRATDARKNKVAMVPVSFAYNKLPESEMLIGEYHEERKKNKEASLREVADMKIKRARRKSAYTKARSLWRRLRAKPVSDCYLSLGEPVVLAPRSEQARQPSGSQLQNELNQVMYRINASTVALPSSVLCLGLLATRDQHLGRQEAVHFLALARDLFDIYDLPRAHRVEFGTDWNAQVDEFLRVPFVNRKFKRNRVKEADILSLSDLDIERATYYKNNILHFFVLPALLSTILLQQKSGETFELHRFLDQMFEKLTLKYFLPRVARANAVDQLLNTFRHHGLVAYTAQRYQIDGSSPKIGALRILAQVGQQLGEDDLLSQFRALQRTDDRFDVDIPVKVHGMARSLARPAELVARGGDQFLLRTSEALEVEDEVRFRPEADESIEASGTVVSRVAEGALVRSTHALAELWRAHRPSSATAEGGLAGKCSQHRGLDLSGVIQSLSTSGALVQLPHRLSRGDLIELSVSRQEHEVRVRGSVVRSDTNSVAVRFENLTSRTETLLMGVLAGVLQESAGAEGHERTERPRARHA